MTTTHAAPPPLNAHEPLPSKPHPSLAALEALFAANVALRMRLTALRLMAQRAQTGSDLERQLAASMLVRMAAEEMPS